MNARVVTKLLILIYGLSITGFGIMEFGHEIAHIIKNRIHHHEADHHHALVDHDLKSQDVQADDDTTLPLSCSFLFFEVYSFWMDIILIAIHHLSLGHNKPVTVTLKPFIPPPAKIS